VRALTRVLSRIGKDPLTWFVLAGGLIFGIYALVDAANRPTIRLTAETRQALVERFEFDTGRKTTAEDIANLAQEFVTNEVLLRSALEAGLHLSDGDIRALLVQKMRLQVTGMLPDPTGADLVNFYADNLARYWSEPGVSFRQVFFRSLPLDSNAVQERLAAVEELTGDPFWQGEVFTAYGHSMIRTVFGQPFLDVVRQLPADHWAGPLRTHHGMHFVRVSEHHESELLPFEVVRSQVESDYLMDLIQTAVRDHVAARAPDYDIRIEP